MVEFDISVIGVPYPAWYPKEYTWKTPQLYFSIFDTAKIDLLELDLRAGGGGENPNTTGVAGGSGVVILRYPDAFTITIGAGLTGSTSTVGSNKVTTLTAGSGNVSWA